MKTISSTYKYNVEYDNKFYPHGQHCSLLNGKGTFNHGDKIGYWVSFDYLSIEYLSINNLNSKYLDIIEIIYYIQ